MAASTRTIGIVIASVIAAGLVLSAVLLSGPLPFHLARANAESTHDLLVTYAAKDSDNDGLPDWEEALYGTNPANPHSVNPSLTDGDAVAQGLVAPKFASATTTPVDTSSIPGVDAAPSTLTDQFARQLFSQYLSERGGTQPTPEDIATFVEQGVANLEQTQSVPDAYRQADIRASGSGPDALLSYAAAAEQAFAAHAVQLPESEVDYFGDAVQKNDTAKLQQVRQIGAAYTATAKAYAAVAVPSEAAVPHLALANALARLGEDITDMSTLESDPLRAYLGLAKYQNDEPKLTKALATLYAVYASEEVVVPDGTTGSSFYHALSSAGQQTP